PRIHLVPTDVAYAMIDILQAALGRIVRRLRFTEAGHECAVIIFALNEEMDDVAISVDAAHHYLAVIVGERFRFHETFAATLRRFVPGRSRIFYFQRD